MTKINLDQVKKLREETGAGVMDCRRALQESEGNEKKAIAYLKKRGTARAAKRQDREVKNGVIASYSHANGQILAVCELACETDFVARNNEFQSLAKEIAMQVAAMNPKGIDELLKQSYIRDEAHTIGQLVTEAVAKIGENILVRRIARFELGK